MTLSLTRFSWLWWGGKQKEQVSNGSVVNSINSLSECGSGLRGGESESLRFYSWNGVDNRLPANRKMKRRWKSREERQRLRKMDKEHDVVLVPSDGVCLSGSESDDSDWSIGWLEPHAPGFQGDVEIDNSFAVLVPCYKHDCDEVDENPVIPFLNAVHNLTVDYSDDGSNYMEQWISYLQNGNTY